MEDIENAAFPVTVPTVSGKRFDKAAWRAYGAAMVPSPCISVCILDRARGHCSGCGRTVAEIAGWSRVGDDEKRRIVATAQKRLAAR